MEINLPYKFKRRDYQYPQFDAYDAGVDRFFKVWHRRAGKDITDLNFEVMRTMERVGNYWHMLPEYNQARKAIWEGKTKDGRAYLDFFPQEIIKNIRRQEMQIELVNGSIWRLVGSDNIDSSIGSGPVGVTFSEFALTNPQAWPYVEPMLLENKGWASFNTTPRGKNHAYELWKLAQNNPKWFTQLLTIDDTRDENGDPIVTIDMINEMRAMGTDEETIQQEYYCSFEGSLQGAYYADQIKWLEENNKIMDFPILPEFPVDTYWDIGKRDYTTIWFMQKIGYEYRLIDYYYESGADIDIFARELKNKGYRYGVHHLPHDAGHLRVGMSGRNIKQQMQDALPKEEFKTLKVTQKVNPDIVATRAFIKRCAFHKTNTKDGLNALKNYTKKWSDTKNMWEDEPLHNWASHGADAFRELAINNMTENNIPRPEVDSRGLPTFNAMLKMNVQPRRI
jgi:hypothetical protein